MFPEQKQAVEATALTDEAIQTAVGILKDFISGNSNLKFVKDYNFIQATLYWANKSERISNLAFTFLDLGECGIWKRAAGVFEGIREQDVELITESNTITLQDIFKTES